MSGSSPSGLRLLALAPYPASAPSTRVRVTQFAPGLRAEGISLDFHPFLDEEAYVRVRRSPTRAAFTVLSALRRLRARLRTAGAYDAVLIQRGMAMLADGALLDLLVETGSPLVYDFDDAVFLSQEGGRRWLERMRDPDGTTRALVRAARVVLAGNAYLADFAKSALDESERSKVRVLPSVVDTRALRPRSSARDEGPPTLGWVGSDSTLGYLEGLASVLRDLATAVPHRLVVSAGNRRPRLDGVAFEFHPWSEGGEAELLASLDVGLYPLDDTPWSRGKCGFKALQYMASGVPCVASPVGVLREIVRPGETGLHAANAAEWGRSCARLLEDADERHRMGAAGRALVESGFSVASATPRLAKAVRDAAETGSRFPGGG